MDSLFLFFHSLLLRALAEEQSFYFSRSSVTGTACLSSAAIILSGQDLNTQNLLGKQGISLLKFFITGQKKSLAKNRMTKAQKAQMARGLWCTGFWGPIPSHFFKRLGFFCLVWLGTSSSACMYTLITVWTCRCSNMGEGNAFSGSSACTNTSVSECTGRGDEYRYADEST